MNVRLTKGLSGLLVVRLNQWALCILRTADLWTRGLPPEIFTAGILFLCRLTACLSLRLRETYGLADSEYIRPNRWACLYLELHRMSLYPSLDLHTACYSGAVKLDYVSIAWRPPGGLGGRTLPSAPPVVPPLLNILTQSQQ